MSAYYSKYSCYLRVYLWLYREWEEERIKLKKCICIQQLELTDRAEESEKQVTGIVKVGHT